MCQIQRLNPGQPPCTPTAHVISEKSLLTQKDWHVCGNGELQKCSFQSRTFPLPKRTRIIRTNAFGGAYLCLCEAVPICTSCTSCITPGCSKYSAPYCGAQKQTPAPLKSNCKYDPIHKQPQTCYNAQRPSALGENSSNDTFH